MSECVNIFYVYIYLDPRKLGQYKYNSYEFSYEPFYVGKGKENRINDKKNDHCENKINKIRSEGFKTIRTKIKKNLEEKDSFELEEELIKLIGREILKEGPLTNILDGGEGPSGYICSEEIKEKLRKDFQEIKKEFERREYILLTEEKEYENNETKLEYIHKGCGKRHSITWGDFQQGYDCPYCKKVKIDFSDIKKEFEGRNYILLTEEKNYKNNKQKLEYIHNKCGNKHSIRWNDFQRGKGCPVCGKEELVKKLRRSFSDIIKIFESYNCILLTKEEDYKNNKQKLEYIHNKCGNKHFVTFSDFQKGKGKNCTYSQLKSGEVWLIKKILNSDYYKSGKITLKGIGQMFSVEYYVVSDIKNKRTWSHIKLENYE